jgi:hypothetical protein
MFLIMFKGKKNPIKYPYGYRYVSTMEKFERVVMDIGYCAIVVVAFLLGAYALKNPWL